MSMKPLETINGLNLPELMRFTDGTPVTADNWEARREEILEVFRCHEYGHTPKGPFTVTSEILKTDERAFASKAPQTDVKLSVTSDEGSFDFPITQLIPKCTHKVPAIVYINFRPNIPDRCYPAEEVIDREVAVFRIYYNDISEDKKGDESGVWGTFDRTKYDWGKIGMWAWACSRVRDYLETLSDVIDLDNVAVLGHSRLGKTALWCAANDTRFKYAFVCNAGCSGDSITRGKDGEHVARIYSYFPHWFCPKYEEYSDNEDAMPFDQHWLVASVAPRYVIGGGAVEDTWADPLFQYLCMRAASPAYEALGLKGFVSPDRMPVPGDTFFEGEIGYFLREGTHYLSRYDWNRYIDFMYEKMEEGR